MLVIDYYARPLKAKYGGVNKSRIELINSFQQYSNFDFIIIDASGGYESEKIPGTTSISLKHYFRRHSLMIPRSIRKYVKAANFIIMHEGWNLGNLYVAFLCWILRRPYFVIPHGVYDPMIVYGLRFKRIRMYLESILLNRASFVNIFFESEREHINKITTRARVVVAPTGVTDLWNKYRWTGLGDYVYFAGRLDIRHKGLDILIRAWADLDTSTLLVLQGQDFFGGVKKLQELILQLNLSDKVILLPHGSHEEVLHRVEECIFFAHISRWESYGRSVVDALSIGAPCLVSNSMNLANHPNAASAMEIVPLEHYKVVEGIQKLLLANNTEFNVCKRIDWVKRSFSWEKTISTLEASMERYSEIFRRRYL